jgi:hypothetical protein
MFLRLKDTQGFQILLLYDRLNGSTHVQENPRHNLESFATTQAANKCRGSIDKKGSAFGMKKKKLSKK